MGFRASYGPVKQEFFFFFPFFGMDDAPETFTSEGSEDSLTNGKEINSTSVCNKPK